MSKIVFRDVRDDEVSLVYVQAFIMDFLPDVLRALSPVIEAHARNRLTQVHSELCRAVGAVDVQLMKEGEKSFHGITQLSNAAREARYLCLTFELPDEALTSSSPATLANSPAQPNESPVPRDFAPETDRFIRDLDSLERRSSTSFVWIKFLVQERIPQLGIPPAEANSFLNRLLQDGIVVTRKVPNPNRPEFPSTSVMLNRDHPVVRRVLTQNEPRKFLPKKFPGPPLSEDIIRDRRARG